LKANALSEIGFVRKENEDNYLVSTEKGLFVVADGMGGHEGGRLASGITIKILDDSIILPDKDIDCPKVLLDALTKANKLIISRGREEDYPVIGTTVTAALFHLETLYIAHIGDSRAYLFRKGSSKLLTQDHSLVNELFQKGGLTLEEAQNHPQRNILTRALGTEPEPQIDLLEISVQAGDELLLCTDGLYNLVSDEEIHSIIDNDDVLKVKVDSLIKKALERGGNDNITAMLIQYE